MLKSKWWVLIIACKWVPNIEFNFDVCVDSRQCLTDTSKWNLTLGTFSGKCPEGFSLILKIIFDLIKILKNIKVPLKAPFKCFQKCNKFCSELLDAQISDPLLWTRLSNILGKFRKFTLLSKEINLEQNTVQCSHQGQSKIRQKLQLPVRLQFQEPKVTPNLPGSWFPFMKWSVKHFTGTGKHFWAKNVRCTAAWVAEL